MKKLGCVVFALGGQEVMHFLGALTALVLVPVVIAAAWVGRVFARRVDQRLFDRIVIVLTVAGSLFLLLLNNAMDLLRVDSKAQAIVMGLLIVLVVALDEFKKRRKIDGH